MSHPQFKLRWVQPDKIEEVSSLFLLQVIRAASTGSSTVLDASLDNTFDEDYGYDATPVTVNEAMLMENRAKIEGINYLEDPSKDMNSLSKYPLVYALFCDLTLICHHQLLLSGCSARED